MELDTKYGTFLISETATGIMAENTASQEQLFIDGYYIPNPDYTHDVSRTILAIELAHEYIAAN